MTLARDSTPEERLVVARVLQGESLYAFTQECMFCDDIDSLRALQTMGRFDFSVDDLGRVRRGDRCVMSSESLPMIDALAALVHNQVSVNFTWETPLTVRRTVSSRLPKLQTSDEVRSFVREVFAATIEHFANMELKILDDDEVKNLTHTKGPTLAVMSAVACAMNDAVLLKNVLTFAGIEGYTQQIRPLEVGLKNVRALRDASTCTPVAYALYFGSTEALALVRPRDVIDGIGRGFLADNSTEVFRVSDAVCPHDQVPSPEMVCSALNLMKSTRAGEFNGEDESWLRDILVQKACSGVWSHLLPMLIEHHPDVFDLDLLVAETQATFHALPGLVAHLLPTMDIPPMSIQAGATNPLPSRHPLYHLVQGVEAGNVERGDVDATLLMVLREMQSRDLMGDVWSGTSTGGKPIVFSSVEHGWTSSLVFLVGAGLDLDQSVSDRTLDEWAKDARNPRSADILRAARARRSALEALDSMASAQAP